MMERFVPDRTTLLLVAPLALLFTAMVAVFVGWLRVHRDVRAPYTRKTFHFIIITAAVLVQLRWGLPGVTVYGAVVAGAVLFAVWRGAGLPFYEALARPADAPRASWFIIVPLLTTALGGVLANVLFPSWAHVGYFVVAWGDAVGEPVGARWGRHQYQVPSFASVRATRSLEGSAAVLLAAVLAALCALLLSDVALARAAPVALLIGAAVALVEAFSHHGTDNLTVQLTGAALAALCL